MIDTRINERKADELVLLNVPLNFRLLLKNGNMIERDLTPVYSPKDKAYIYRDQRIVYKGIEKPITSINISDTRSLRKIENTELPSHSNKNGEVKHTIINLLKMNYEVINL